jgi:hypothetical protein
MICRHAKSNDVPKIFGLLEEVAPKIPLNIEGDDRKEMLRKLVKQCCECGESWVATNDDDRLVGFQIIRPSEAGRRFDNDGEPQSAGLMLEYGGVTEGSIGQGIFRALIDKTKLRRLPLYAAVKRSNHSRMSDRLLKMGFEKFAVDDHFQQDHFRQRP